MRQLLDEASELYHTAPMEGVTFSSEDIDTDIGSLRRREAPSSVRRGNGWAASARRRRRPRFLCLHRFRTSGEIMRKQVVGKWPADVTARLDLVFADAPFPTEGKSEIEGIFDPPYYEWFQFSKNFTEYRNFDECLDDIEELMIKEGPFDGLMGFSQVHPSENDQKDPAQPNRFSAVVEKIERLYMIDKLQTTFNRWEQTPMDWMKLSFLDDGTGLALLVIRIINDVCSEKWTCCHYVIKEEVVKNVLKTNVETSCRELDRRAWKVCGL